MKIYNWLDDFGDIIKKTNYPPPNNYKYSVDYVKRQRYNTKHDKQKLFEFFKHELLDELGEGLF